MRGVFGMDASRQDGGGRGRRSPRRPYRGGTGGLAARCRHLIRAARTAAYNAAVDRTAWAMDGRGQDAPSGPRVAWAGYGGQDGRRWDGKARTAVEVAMDGPEADAKAPAGRQGARYR
jgi:hypothetical protein